MHTVRINRTAASAPDPTPVRAPDWTYFDRPLVVHDGRRICIGDSDYPGMQAVCTAGIWTHYSDGGSHLLVEHRERIDSTREPVLVAADPTTYRWHDGASPRRGRPFGVAC